MDDKKVVYQWNTQFREEKLVNEALSFLNSYYGFTEHPLTLAEFNVLSNYDFSLKVSAMLWKEISPKTTKKINYYYRINPLDFVRNFTKNMDLMHCHIYSEIIEKLQQKNIKKILEFGGGAGILTLKLYKAGFDVTFCEMGKIYLEWMKYLTKKFHYNIKIIDCYKEKIKEKYDIIICKDVIEHIKNVNNFFNYLKKWTDILLITPFHCEEISDYEPMHFKMRMDNFVKPVEDNKPVNFLEDININRDNMDFEKINKYISKTIL
jgi:hypothetical protein